MRQVPNAHLIVYLRWLETVVQKQLWNVDAFNELSKWYIEHYVDNIRLGSDGRFWLVNEPDYWETDSIKKMKNNEFRREVPWLYWGEEE